MQKVSVVIPTRNRPEMLGAAIGSVLAQTFTDYEIIVVINGPDNPSTPKTRDVAAAAGCRIVRVERAGIAVALNAGIEAARGEWIAFLDDDDLWEPNRLEAALKVADAAADVIFCNIVKFDAARSALEPPLRPPSSMPVAEAMTLKNYGGGCSPAMARRAAILDVGGFDAALNSPDWGCALLGATASRSTMRISSRCASIRRIRRTGCRGRAPRWRSSGSRSRRSRLSCGTCARAFSSACSRSPTRRPKNTSGTTGCGRCGSVSARRRRSRSRQGARLGPRT
jgi:hypothetical protein